MQSVNHQYLNMFPNQFLKFDVYSPLVTDGYGGGGGGGGRYSGGGGPMRSGGFGSSNRSAPYGK